MVGKIRTTIIPVAHGDGNAKENLFRLAFYVKNHLNEIISNIHPHVTFFPVEEKS